MHHSFITNNLSHSSIKIESGIPVRVRTRS
jgi:hypothetical protein